MDQIYSDSDADLTLISSDNVAFRVYAFHLGTSPVLMDMIKVLPRCKSDIPFSDSQMEDSHTIRYLLNILHNNHSELDWNTLGFFRNTISFVKKYEMILVQSFLSVQLRRYLENGGAERYCFILAAELDDISIAAAIIEKGGRQIFVNNGDKYSSGWFDQGQIVERQRLIESGKWGFVDGCAIMNPTAWPLWELRRVPFEYVNSLGRTYQRFPFGHKTSDVQAAAQYFKQLMEDLKV
ncbi:uncharacterized protein L199_001025 [Kwoniella botswanensis]|uniref:uncharacterized protein n=1 Tax=Kwoniella botswanensis TaxID=1268659 RepID=UPI00315DEB2B